MIAHILKLSLIIIFSVKAVTCSTNEPTAGDQISAERSSVVVLNNDSHPTLYDLNANGQTYSITATELLTLANIATKGKTPSALNISPSALTAIQGGVSFLNGAIANGTTNSPNAAQNMQTLLTNLVSIEGGAAMHALKKMGAENATHPLNLALTAVAAATNPTEQLISQGKITPQGCCNCVLGTALTFAQILAQQQAQAAK